ncbi:MAG TPA: hypothetical protein VFX42_01915 [Gemmatimonadales bacterium]|nr:hypothetical protein [Gemmatimonadales bacterium]
MTAVSRKRSLVSWGAVGAALLVLAGVGLLLARRPASDAPVLGKRSAVTLDPGLEINPALSPDGKLVAYNRMTPSETRLVVQQLAGGEPVTVTQWPSLSGAMPAWSPQGDRLVYTSPLGLQVIPALGGVSRLLVAQISGLGLRGRVTGVGWGSWAPNGEEVVYTSTDTVYTLSINTGTPKLLVKTLDPSSPVWSPDGQWIAYVSGNPAYVTVANLAPSSIWVVRAKGGTPVRITADRPLHASPVWLPDSRSLLYISNQDGGRDVYFVRLSRSGAPAAGPVRMTTGLYPHTISVSADGRRLVYAVHTETSNIVALTLQRGRSVSLRDAKPVTSGSQQIESFAVSPDGRWLVFDSNRNGNQDIWRMPLDRSAPPELLSAGPEDEFQPTYSADGSLVSFHATRSGSTRDMYLIPAKGGPRTRIEVQTQNNLAPQLSPDGRSVLYSEWGVRGEPRIEAARRSDEGWGRTTPLFTLSATWGEWSPDGKSLAFLRRTALFRAEPDGENPRQLLALPAGFSPLYMHWSDDSRLIYYSGIKVDGTYLIYEVPATGGNGREIVHSEGPSYQNYRFNFRVHGRTLYTAFADRQSDIWLAEVVSGK